MRKVIYVITKGRWGGAGRYVYDLATSLPWQKFKVQVLIGEGEELPRRLGAEGVPVISLSELERDIRWFNDWRSFRRLYRVFRREGPDIVHLNSSKAGLLGALAARFAGVPWIVFTAHGWAFNEDRPRLIRWTIKFLHWLTILFCHQVIAVSEKTKRQFARWPAVGRKMAVIHNGLSSDLFPGSLLAKKTARESLLGPVARQHPGLWLGTIAELHSNKGIKYLLSALRLTSDVFYRQGLNFSLTVVVIGEGEERTFLEGQIKALDLEKIVFLVGYRQEAARFLPAFDIFVLTSITEALPYVILEAGAAGLPVLATAVGGLPEIVSSMETGVLVRPRRPDELARALKFLLDEPAKRARFGESLRRKVRREFSLQKMVKETVRIYEKKK